MKRIETQASLLAKHRKQLDAVFLREYPKGQFVIQIYKVSWRQQILRVNYGLYLNYKRRTSQVSSTKGLFYTLYNGVLKKEEYQNNSFGKCYLFSYYPLFIDAAYKKGIPRGLIDAFDKDYRHAQEGEKNEKS